jgi:PAS domain S-box-containing protein
MADTLKNSVKRPMDSESLYRQVFDMAMDGISIIDEDGVYIDTNQAYCEILGFSYDEIVGTHAEEFIVPEDRYKLREEYIPKILSEGGVRLDSIMIRKDGTLAPVEVSGVKFTHAGKPGFLSIVHDLRDRKSKEAELAESEERYRILTENVTDGVMVIQNGSVKFVNNAFTSLFAVDSTKDVVNKGLEILSCQDLEDFFIKEDEALVKGDLSEGIFVARCNAADGREIWVEARDKKITWDGSPAILATLRDVTESRQEQIAIEEEKEDLFRENITLRSTMKDRFRLGDIIGKSHSMQKIYDLILKASASDVGVAIYGESGTGKELIARNIHQMSARSENAFVPVNCGAIPDTLFESEFFGHKKGSFTGAHRDKQGFFDLAHGGTLFLDEVGELTPGNQVKLLRALDGGGYRPVGGDENKESTVRIIVATNRNLAEMIKKGLMREDFFYRVHIIPITVPPLREHKEDIQLLIEYFFQKSKEKRKIKTLPVKILEAMYKYDWPGNIRELENVLQRYTTLGRIDFLEISETQPAEMMDVLPEFNNENVGFKGALEEFEKQYLVRVLEQNHWHRGKTSAALKLPSKTLYRKMKKYQLL